MNGSNMPKNNKLRGEVFGVSGATISRWCSGTDMPELSTCCAIADYFDLSLDYLLLGREPVKKLGKAERPTLFDLYPELDAETLDNAESLMRSLARTSQKKSPAQ